MVIIIFNIYWDWMYGAGICRQVQIQADMYMLFNYPTTAPAPPLHSHDPQYPYQASH